MQYRRLIQSIVLGGILFSCACAHTTGPKHLSESTYAATKVAVEELEHASASRNASASIFDPKLQVAAKAASEIYNEMGSASTDGYAVNQLQSCVEDLKVYRSAFESRESASHPIEEQLKGLKGTEIKDAVDVVQRSNQELDDCIKAAKDYL